MLNCCCCFYILILLCGNIIGHSSIIFLKYFIRFLCCNWYFYNVFELLKDCLIVMLSKQFGKTFQNIYSTFVCQLYHFIPALFRYFTNISHDVFLITNRCLRKRFIISRCITFILNVNTQSDNVIKDYLRKLYVI